MTLNDLQLDALREMANIGSGTAATALASMLGQSVDLHVPTALALELADAVDAVGNAEDEVSAVIIGAFGDLDATVLLLFDPDSANTLCSLLGVVDDPEMQLSALGEIGNILGSSYVQAMGRMTGLHMEPHPPVAMADMLGAIVASVLAITAADTDLALLLDSKMTVDGTECKFGFLYVPSGAGVALLLDRLGLGEAA
jgi:chemotaxis protein CheC